MKKLATQIIGLTRIITKRNIAGIIDFFELSYAYEDLKLFVFRNTTNAYFIFLSFTMMCVCFFQNFSSGRPAPVYKRTAFSESISNPLGALQWSVQFFDFRSGYLND